MYLHLKVIDTHGLLFERRLQLDAPAVLAMSEARMPQMLAHGRAHIERELMRFGTQLLHAAQQRQSDDELYFMAFNIVMSAWLLESTCCGLSASDFALSNLHLCRRSDGALRYECVRSGPSPAQRHGVA